MSLRENLPPSCADAELRERSALSPEELADLPPSAPSGLRDRFRSVLALASDDEQAAEESEAPSYFRDLNLDQIVASITFGKQAYNLAPFFNRTLRTADAVEYRQDVIRDLEDPRRLEAIDAFASDLRTVRDHVAQAAKLHYKLQDLAWSLDAIELYGNAAKQLLSALLASPPRSTGLSGFSLGTLRPM